VERRLPDESVGVIRTDIDESIRDVYNPVSFVDLRSRAFACHERVTAGGLEEDQQTSTFETQTVEAGALSPAAAAGGTCSGLSVFRYRDASGCLLRV
jgi:hypothetical protein